MSCKISVIIHAKNEEKNIENCLKMLFWADEIVLIDEESRDKTALIAKQYTEKVFSMPSKGIVEYNRNEGLKLAKNEWVLVLDADELISYHLVLKLKEIVEQDSADVVFIPRCNFNFGIQFNHKNKDYQLRFFKKSHVHYVPKIHAYPECKEHSKILKLQESSLAIIHLSNNSVEGWQDKANRYSTAKAKELFQENTPFSLLQLLVLSFKTAIRELLLDKKLFQGFNGLFFTYQSIYDHYLVFMKLKLMRQHKTVDYQDSVQDQYDKIAHNLYQSFNLNGKPYG